MAQVVFVLGAGFNCSVLDTSRGKAAPLARSFFQMLVQQDHFGSKLDGFRQHVYVDLLLDEIKRYWHLDLEALRSEPFDIEECLTLFQSLRMETADETRQLELCRAEFALRQLLLEYLSDLYLQAYTPTASQFGADVLTTAADVLTFNYDTVAEEAIASASGIGPKPMPDSFRAGAGNSESRDEELPDEDLDASHFLWRAALAHGFKFDEAALPVAGVTRYADGSRYYAHPNNQLYEANRVLKLHGSINWLRYTNSRAYPFPEETLAPKQGILLERYASYWLGEPPTRGPWRMDPVIIPPYLYKNLREHPFPEIWTAALQTLRECETLFVVGYSFPATDFRTRRLFLEAFSEHTLRNLVVVNPDPNVVRIARQLTHFDGAVTTCDDLSALYGLPKTWFERAEPPQAPPASPEAHAPA